MFKTKTVFEVEYDEINTILNGFYGPCWSNEDYEWEAISWVESQESRNDTCECHDLPFSWFAFDQKEWNEMDDWLTKRNPNNVPSTTQMLNELVLLGLLPEGSYLINISW